ncbi:MAG: hypothetical protein MJ141_01890 [Clostridia bacterium]|nr:hypothetical protein [Clostridia bacterium]
MEKEKLTAEEGVNALTGGDAKGKLRKLLPILAGPDGKKLMALLYLSGNDPQKLRSALEKASHGDGKEAGEIMSRLLSEPEGEAILAKLFAALKE